MKVMSSKEEKLFQEIDIFIEEFIKKMENIPEELDHVRLYFANQMICQATIWGARNIYEGVGMLEAAKLEYVEVCREVEEQREDVPDSLENKFYIPTPKKGDLLN